MLNTHSRPNTDPATSASSVENALEYLLSPLTVDRFFHEHWSRQGLYIQGDPAKFARFPGLAQLPALLAGRLSSTHWSKGHSHNAQRVSSIEPDTCDRSARGRRLGLTCLMP